MGASSSRLPQARSQEIDRQLEEDSLRFKKEIPILVLGTHEKSKSTLIKQMKLVHGGFTPGEELAEFRSAIHKTVIEAAQALVLALQKRSRLDGMLAEEHRHLPETILRAKAEDALSPKVADAIEALWRTTAAKRLLDDEDFTLPDNGSFFTEIQRLAQPQYIPTENDVLRTPAQKSTVTETRFNMGALSIRLIDVGPLRKWIHCFESVTSIIFCTALSDYDQVLLEERGLTRMHESLVLFDSIVNSRWFMRTSIILFLTKIDVFRAKIHKISSANRHTSQIPLSTYFPEYIGGPDINNAARFVLWRFMQANRARLSVYPHLTHANDTANVRLVFAAVKETILQNALMDSKVLETQVL
ncbi:Heterotrimeric G-protein alpha subunit [Mycena sanguinolenta]|uniref:Heterotrimeric G-protein alpha subunit n=1 Tax=Mycena sanguinolenta TaxID=230812 RepID=A0A8H6X481_9AGAR|nr:Heterotrimeric G-protein alpha subunit [Mycena sanguinolenta]